METAITIITLTVTNLITNLILLNFFSIKYRQKYESYVTFIFFLLSTIFMVIINLLNNSSLNLLAYIGIFAMLNCVIFELKSTKDIVINISFFLVIFLLLDSICYVLMETILKDINSFLEVNLKIITASLMQFIIYNILKIFILKKETHALSKKDVFSYISISIFSLLLMGACATYTKDANRSIKYIFFVIAIGTLILNVWYVNTLELLSQKYELEESVKWMNVNSKMIFKYYHSLEEKEELTRAILHDIKNHLQVLEKAVEESQGKENEYLNEVKNKISKLTTERITNRKILNILFLEKIEEASKYKININFDVDAIDTSFIKDFDLITIFSNILDNAIEAVKELNESDRVIDINIKKVNDFLLICERNPCANILKKNRGKIFTNKKGHSGLGLQNIERILQNYDANMVVEIDENLIFSNTIMFTN